MASRKSKKSQGNEKPRRERAANRKSSINYAFFYRLIRLSVQIASVLGIFYGLSNLPSLVSGVGAWKFQGPIDSTLAWNWLSFFVPFFLSSVVLWSAARSLRRFSYIRKSLASFPDKPWQADPNWRGGCIALEERMLPRRFGFVLVILGLVLIPLSIALEWKATYSLCWFTGVLAVWFAILRVKNTRYYGSKLKLRNESGFIGGPFVADFVTNQAFPENTIFEATLQCDYSIPGRDDRPARREVLWSDTICVGKRLEGEHSHSTWVPLHFTIPSGNPVSSLHATMDGERSDVKWRLCIEPRRSFSLMASFIVPVFHAANASDLISKEATTVGTYQPPGIASELQFYGVSEAISDDGRPEWVFLCFQPKFIRQGIMAIAFGIAAIVLIAILVPSWVPSEAYVLVIFLCIFPVLFVSNIVLRLVGSALWSCRLVINEKSLDVTYGYSGFKKNCQIPRDDSTSLLREKAAQLEVGELWDLSLSSPSFPSKIKVIEGINSKREAMLLQQELGTRIGIRCDEEAGPSVSGSQSD